MLNVLTLGLQTNPLPEYTQKKRDPKVSHAPIRPIHFTPAQKKLAVKNALRYFPSETHEVLAPEFLEELELYGHIYMYRFILTEVEMKAYPLDQYPAKLSQTKAIQMMIMNNLDPAVAQHPHELITYGGNGAVFSNWAQFRLVMKYLSEMNEDQTLVMYSGHPLGLFPSTVDSPRVVITNGMVIPNYSSKEHLEEFYGLGVSMYGQMTAGSYCYIGPQGIVHGTTLTLLNAARKYLGTSELAGKVFVTSGLGGMSGAQPKAADIVGAISVTAEVDEIALNKRHAQGWVQVTTSDLSQVVAWIKEAKAEGKALSIGYLGNVVDLWEYFSSLDEHIVDLGSDQTSCHNPYNGGYYPVELSFEEAKKMMVEDPETFKTKVQDSLRRQIAAINSLCSKGMKFWDYGNSFLLECSRANADVVKEDGSFIYPSYVEDIMGDIFSLGFGPFRWVCTSREHSDLQKTDEIAANVCEELAEVAPEMNKQQYLDNHLWITKAEENKLVVGSEARILYSDALGRLKIALKFNEAVAAGDISQPVVISRDHHDVSGTDSPWRETSNITDGSKFTADMAVQNFCGLGMRGATWIALHNGGGTGWGEAMNGGFGMVLDGTEAVNERLKRVLRWDVLHGVARRAWSGNEKAFWTITRSMDEDLQVTVPNWADDELLDRLI